MNKYADFLSSLILSLFVYLLWIFKGIFAATPDEFNFGISALIFFNLLLFSNVYCSYLKKTNLILLNSLFVFSLSYSWFSSTKASFTSNYNVIDTFITLLCFILSLIQLTFLLVNAVTKYKNKKYRKKKVY